MLKLVRIGLYLLFAGAGMELVYNTAPAAYQNIFDAVLGPGGMYAHIVTGVGIVMSMLVLHRAPEKRVRIKRTN